MPPPPVAPEASTEDAARLTAFVPVTVKLPWLWSLPLGLNTDTRPVVAPDGTVAVICVLLYVVGRERARK